VRSLSSVAPPTRYDRILVLGGIALVLIITWAYLVHLSDQMSASADHDDAMAAMGMAMDHAWGSADALAMFAMWVVMMVAMMAGAAAPVLLLFAAALRSRGAPGVPFTVLLFGFGYLTVWVVFSAAATAVQWLLHDAALLSPSMAASSSRIGGAILVAAGAYQVTPWKGACLAHCRSPLGFLMTHWRDGRAGALSMGVQHGAYCLGCCWALMGILFAVGVMNLAWVAVLTILIFLEKLGEAGMRTAQVAGVLLMGFGAAMAAGVAI
jgi:predicted metal-binding membrane protein